ncbi:MAG: hypothetical protein HY646_11395 [Acidobacteria bacterium]|nr:hypothetical protein [Acidobacteriota bacterium]
MKRNILIVITLSVGLIAATVPMMAHHAVSAEFDATKPIKFTGTVKSVDWMNPHIYVHIESKDESGKVTVYSVEGGPPNSLFRQGWRKDSLKPGDVVQVSGSRAKKAESNRVNGQIVMPDGRVFARGAANPGASQQ